MTKIQVVGDLNSEKFQNLINNFIADKKVIDIKYQTFPITTEFRGSIPYKQVIADRALIIYEEE